MLIIALVLAAIGLAALVFAVVTSSELVAWVCIGASLLGVVLLIIDALQERRRRTAGGAAAPSAASPQGEPATSDYAGANQSFDADYPEDESDESLGTIGADEQTAVLPEDQDETVSDNPKSP